MIKTILLGLALVASLSGCTRQPMQPTTPPQAQSLSGQGVIHLTLMDLTQTASSVMGQAVQLQAPDGAITQQSVGSVEQGQPTVRFTGLDLCGTYRFGFSDQAATKPRWQSAVLDAQHPTYDGQLQVAGASILLQGAKNLFYPYNGNTWYFTVLNQPVGDRGIDLQMSMAGLPAGGQAVFTPSFLRSGQSGELRLTIPGPNSLASLTLTAQGWVGQQLVAQAADLHPVRDWDVSVSVTVSNQISLDKGLSIGNFTYSLTATAQFSFSGLNIPAGSPMHLRFVNATLLGFGISGSDGPPQNETVNCATMSPDVYASFGGAPGTTVVGFTETWPFLSSSAKEKKIWWRYQYSLDLGSVQIPVYVYCNWCSSQNCSSCEGQKC